MSARTTGSPNCSTIRPSAAVPLAQAATRAQVGELGFGRQGLAPAEAVALRQGPGLDMNALVVDRAAVRGLEPNVSPPMSAWRPRAAVKNRRPTAPKTGMTKVMSGRWIPPGAEGVQAKASPGRMSGLAASAAFALAPMRPRCAGLCGALAIRSPAASKTARRNPGAP